jgi:WD40 repeat protein
MIVIDRGDTRYREDMKDFFMSYGLCLSSFKALSVNNDHAAILSHGGQVLCIRLPCLFCESKFSVLGPGGEDRENIADILLLPDSNKIVVSSCLGTIKLIDTRSHSLLGKLKIRAYVEYLSYLVCFVEKGRFGRYIVHCSPSWHFCIIDMEKLSEYNMGFDTLSAIGRSKFIQVDGIFRGVTFIDEKTLAFRAYVDHSSEATIVWNFVDDCGTRVDLMYGHDSYHNKYGLKAIDGGKYLCEKINPSTMVLLKRVNDLCFVKHVSFSMVDCNLILCHIVDDYCLVMYSYRPEDLYYFVVFDKETFKLIGGVNFLHSEICSVQLTPDGETLVVLSWANGEFFIGAIDVRRLIEYVIS